MNAGVFVLATTHSDIVLEQINNAVRSGKLGGNGKSREKGGSVSLGIDKVSAYAFDSVVKGKRKLKKWSLTARTVLYRTIICGRLPICITIRSD